jgi:carboxymethylenebutenolidase
MTKYAIFLLVLLTLCSGLWAQDFALKQLEQSPRHQEWVKVKSGNRTIRAFVVYPQKAVATAAVVVIHENRGLTAWVRSFADQLAGAGYLVIAPDLLSDFDSLHSHTSTFENEDAARNAIYQLNPDNVAADLNAVQAFIAKDPACNGKTAVIGFCWGGAQSFRMATYNKEVKAAMVFYGGAPEDSLVYGQISTPVYGFYGGNDQRINAGIPKAAQRMKAAGKVYEAVTYPGAGHAYMRLGDDPAGAEENKAARAESWTRIKEILAKL